MMTDSRPADGATAIRDAALLDALPHAAVLATREGVIRAHNHEAAVVLGAAAITSGRITAPWFARVVARPDAPGERIRVMLRRRGARRGSGDRLRCTVTTVADAAGTDLLLLMFERIRSAAPVSGAGYHQFLDQQPDAIVIHRHGRVVYANATAVRLFRARSSADALGRDIFDFVHPEHRLAVRERQQRLAATGEPAPLMEQKLLTLDGSVIDAEVGAFRIVHEGAPAIQLAIRDIHERQRAEAGLYTSEERYRAIVEGLQDHAVLMVDTSGTVTSWNTSAERITGFAADEMIGQPLSKLFPPENADTALRSLEVAAREGRYEEEGWRVRKDGTRVLVSVVTTALCDPQQRVIGFARIKRDLSERVEADAALRRKEEQLRHAQKMEAVGRLTGGIAHDFNNLLTAIRGHAQFLVEDLPAEHKSLPDAQEVQRCADRAMTLTRQLLTFSRRQPVQPIVLNVNGVAREMQEMCRRLIRPDIEFSMRLADALWPVCMDRGHLEQVIINLLVNARDAIAERGHIRIATRNIELGDQYLPAVKHLQPGPYVQVSITDNGVGMDAELQARIFEPFFTTKPEGEGTGLGLATVYGIVQQSGGHITVYSEHGRGTTFKVFLPRATTEAVQQHAPGNGKAPHAVVKGTILIAEDDASVRAFAARVLSGRGFSVVDVATGSDALAAVAAHPHDLDLLLTDVIMPEMSGRRLAERVRDIVPAVRTVFMSGFTHEDMIAQGLLGEGEEFLEKPFSPDELVHKVLGVLGRGGMFANN